MDENVEKQSRFIHPSGCTCFEVRQGGVFASGCVRRAYIFSSFIASLMEALGEDKLGNTNIRIWTK